MNIRAITVKAVAAIALSGALAGLGAGVAEAKPMQRDHAKYCAKLVNDEEFTRKAFLNAYNKYGPHDVLTRQAASNYDPRRQKVGQLGLLGRGGGAR